MYYLIFLFVKLIYFYVHLVIFLQDHLLKNSQIYAITKELFIIKKYFTLVSILRSLRLDFIFSTCSSIISSLSLALFVLLDDTDLDNLGRRIVVFIVLLVNPVESNLFFLCVKSPKDCVYRV
jgi:hypothetical protein